MELLELFAILSGCLICGVIGAVIGQTRNNGGGGFFLGLLLGPIGWIIVLMMDDPTMKPCPTCKGKCPGDATRCQHCGVEFFSYTAYRPSLDALSRRSREAKAMLAEPIKTTCPHCDQPLEIPESLVDKKMICPACQKEF